MTIWEEPVSSACRALNSNLETPNYHEIPPRCHLPHRRHFRRRYLLHHIRRSCTSPDLQGIFGYDIGISSGVTSMPSFFKKFFPSVYRKEELDTSTNQHCKFDSETLTLFTSSPYLAALCSSIIASTVTRKLGRKLSMFFGGILFCADAILNGFASAVWMLIVGRILLDFGIRFANQAGVHGKMGRGARQKIATRKYAIEG